MITAEYRTKTSKYLAQRNRQYPQVTAEPVSVLSRTRHVTAASTRTDQPSVVSKKLPDLTYVTDDVYAMTTRDRFVGSNNQGQSHYNDITHNENLPPSSPPFRNSGTPLFQLRNRQTNHNRSASWDLLPPPPSDSETSITSNASMALPVFTRNRLKDRDMVRKLATSTEAILPTSSRSRMDENMTTLQPGFNEDDVDPNTPSLERNLLKAAQREIDQSRYDAARKGIFRGTGSSIGSNSEEGSDSRKDHKNRRLMDTLTRPRARSQRHASASDIKMTMTEGDDAIKDIQEMKRSLSNSSTDSRRRSRNSPILTLGANSPSRRRRLGRGYMDGEGEQELSMPTALHMSGKLVPISDAATHHGAYSADDTDKDMTVTETIDWLAAAISEPAQDFPIIRQPRDRQDNIQTNIEDHEENPNNSEASHLNRGDIFSALRSTSLSVQRNNILQRQKDNLALFPTISVIDEMSEPPTSSPATYPIESRRDRSNNGGASNYISRKMAETSWLEINNADETRDVLRQISRASSHSPPSFSPEASTIRQIHHDRKSIIKEGQVDPEAFLSDSIVDQSTRSRLSRNHRSSQKNGDEQTTPKINNKNSRISSTSKSTHKPTTKNSQHTIPSANRRSDETISKSFASKLLTKVPAAWPGTPDRNGQSNRTLNDPTSTSHKSMLRSPVLSDYEELTHFNISSIKFEALDSPLDSRKHKLAQKQDDINFHHMAKTKPDINSTIVDINLTIDQEEGYHTDDSLDRLLANDTDFSSLLRKERFEDESFLLAATIDVEPSKVSTEQRQKELAVQARLLSRLQTLQLEIRAARKGIEVIERKIAFEDGEGVDSASSVEMMDSEEYDGNDQLLMTKRRMNIGKMLQTMFRKPSGALEWSLVVFLFFMCIAALEFKLWSNTIIPEYSTISSEEWFAMHPPGQYQPGATLRFFASLILVVLNLFWSLLKKVFIVVSYLLGGIRWIEHLVMNQIMPPPPILESFPQPELHPVIVEEFTKAFS